MKETSLPSPGIGSKAMHLRRIAANYISSLEQVSPKYAAGTHPGATALSAFFTACKNAADALGLTTPVLTLTTAGNATSVAIAATLATTLGKGGSGGTATYTSSDPSVATVNASGVVTGVAVGQVTITATVAAATTYRAAQISIPLNVTA